MSGAGSTPPCSSGRVARSRSTSRRPRSARRAPASTSPSPSRSSPPRRRSRSRGSRSTRASASSASTGAFARSPAPIAAAEGAVRAGLRRVLCPADSSEEAALAGVEAVGVRHLAEAVGYLLGHAEIAPAARGAATARRGASRPRRRARAGAWAAGARDRRRGVAQPPPRRPAGHREDDAGAPDAVDPPAALA